jgi:hypothetical protein
MATRGYCEPQDGEIIGWKIRPGGLDSAAFAPSARAPHRLLDDCRIVDHLRDSRRHSVRCGAGTSVDHDVEYDDGRAAAD